MRLGIISNRNGGTSGSEPTRLRAVAADAGAIHAETQSPCEVPDVLRRMARADVEVVAVHGGDGTLDTVMTSLRNDRPFAHEPAIALLRGGTTNMVHRDVGIPGPAHRALRRLVARLADSGAPTMETRRMIALRRSDSEVTSYGFFFAAAAIPRAILAVRSHLHSKGLTGPFGEAVALGALVFNLLGGRVENDPILRPDAVELEIDGRREDAPKILVLATTVERLILGLRPVDPCGRMGVAYLPWPYRRLWRSLPTALFGKGRDRGSGGLRSMSAGRLELGGQTPCMLDGEIVERPPSTSLVLLPSEPVRFVRP